MEKWRNYSIVFSGLSLGKHTFGFEIGQSFFDLFDFEQDFKDPELAAEVILDKRETMLDLSLKLNGTIKLHCDLTYEEFDQPIQNEEEIIIKFGEYEDLTDDEIWIIQRGEHQINVAQIIYELTLLSIPNKRIHPDVLEGKSDSEMLELLNKYSFSANNEEEKGTEEDIDPRWEKLKSLGKNTKE